VPASLDAQTVVQFVDLSEMPPKALVLRIPQVSNNGRIAGTKD
jgi:hypothetical protein